MSGDAIRPGSASTSGSHLPVEDQAPPTPGGTRRSLETRGLPTHDPDAPTRSRRHEQNYGPGIEPRTSRADEARPRSATSPAGRAAESSLAVAAAARGRSTSPSSAGQRPLSTPDGIRELVEPSLKEIAAVLAKAQFQAEADGPRLRNDYLNRCHDYGGSDAAWRQFLANSAGTVKYGESASAGARLASLNDTQGVLRVQGPCLDIGGRTMTSNETFEVIREHVPAAGIRPAADYWYVKGEGGRLVRFSELQRHLDVTPTAADHGQPGITPQAAAIARRNAELLRIHDEYKHPPGGGPSRAKETPLRTLMKKLSDESELAARRDEFESPDQKLTGIPPNETPFAPREGWSNMETSFFVGAGPRLGNMRLALVGERNNTEGRVIIQVNDNRALSQRGAVSSSLLHPTPGHELRSIDELHGDILAQFQGVAYIEALAPAHIAGVKSGNMKRFGEALRACVASDEEAASPKPVQLRLTMQDDTVHDLTFGPDGIHAKLHLPKPSWSKGENGGLALGLGDQPEADISLYSYRGADGGVKTTPDGTVDPKVVLSTGQALMAGPLIKSRTGVAGNALRIGEALGNLTVGTPAFGARTPAAIAVSVATAVAIKFGLIFGEIILISEALKAGTGHTDAAGKAVFFEGSKAVSAAGKASVTAAQIAAVACLIVVANELISLMKRELKRMVPEYWHQPESGARRAGVHLVGGSAEEALRLSVGAGIQNIPSFDFGRFTAADIPMLGSVAAQGVAKTLKGRIGAPENHPALHAAVNTLVIGLYELVSRSLSIQQGAKLMEAIVTRATTRLIDKVVVSEWGGAIGNATGAFGPNASAYADQLDRETRFGNMVAFIKNAMNTVVLHGGSMTDQRRVRRFEQRAEQFGHAVVPWILSRFDELPQDLRAEVALQEQYLHDLKQAQEHDARTPGSNTAQAVADGARDVHRQRVDTSRRQLGQEPVFGTDVATHVPSYDTRGLDKTTVRFDSENRAAFDAWTTAQPNLKPHEVTRAPVSTGIDGKPRSSIGVKADTARRPEDVRRDNTTFSRYAQANARRVTAAMKQFGPIRKDLENVRMQLPGQASAQPLPRWLIDDMLIALTVYTEQSQPVHYKNRYPVLEGTPRWRELAPGLFVERMITSQPGNRTGDQRAWVDARTQILMNLAANLLGKMPTEFYRTVNTLAYYDTLEAGKDLPPGQRGQDPITRRTIEPGTNVHMTETLSVSLDPAGMPPGFGLSVANHGADAPERSLMIVGFATTTLNIADVATLSQAEAITTPGVVMQVDHIHAMDQDDVSANDWAAGHRKLGQVVYMSQVDTYQWEKAFHSATDWLNGKAGARRPSPRDLLLDPDTNALYQFDESAGGLRKVDAIPADDNAHERLDARLRSYFHGKPCWSDVWMEPYTSPGTLRGTKDDLHDMLVDGKMKPYIELAVRNPHHAEFRRLGGFEGSEADNSQKTRQAALAHEHGQIATTLSGLSMASPLDQDKNSAADTTRMITFLAAGLLRRPVELVPVQGAGDAVLNGPITYATAYDGADLSMSLHSHQEQKERPILVGVAPDGYYAVTKMPDTAEYAATHRIRGQGTGLTLGNLLHAIVHREFKDNASLTSAVGAGPKYSGSNDELRPNRAAHESVKVLWQRMLALACTEFSVVQKGLVKERLEILPDPALEALVKTAPAWIMPPGVPSPDERIEEQDDAGEGSSAAAGARGA